jgi:hypothetical protein
MHHKALWPLTKRSDKGFRGHAVAMLRRLAGSPVPPEDFIEAAVDAVNLGIEQPEPVSPDAVWPEAPGGAI